MSDIHNWQNPLRCLSDPFTPVRDTDGRLLGAIPKVAEDTPFVSSSSGQNFELRVAAQLCVCVDLRSHNPRSLGGFIQAEGVNLRYRESQEERIVRELREGEIPAGENPDVGQPV